MIKTISSMLFVLSILPSTVFAQDYLTVKPPFLKDHSDACSKLVEKITLSEFYNNLQSYISVSNRTQTTSVYYNNTQLLVTFSPLSIPDNLGYIYGGSFGPPPNVYKSDSKLLLAPIREKISLEYDKTGHFTEALTNIGNKTVNVTHPFGYLLSEAVYFQNGTMLPFYSYLINNLPYSYGVPEWPDIIGTELKPGQSIMVHEDPISVMSNLSNSPLPPGNYTMKVFARVIGDVGGTCTTVFLWSQPVDLTILPPEKIPEFPFVIPILMISIISVIIFYKVKFR